MVYLLRTVSLKLHPTNKIWCVRMLVRSATMLVRKVGHVPDEGMLRLEAGDSVEPDNASK